TGSNAIAEELAQDAFAQMYPRFADVLEPKSYLRTTTINVCRNWHRRHRRELDRFERHGATEDRSADSVEELIDVIAALPYRQRAVLVMRYWLDLSEADIAYSLGCRPGTVKSLHSRALAAIRKDLPWPPLSTKTSGLHWLGRPSARTSIPQPSSVTAHSG
ncbi:MAG: sigma-70 family RNA polymerase sigma factor, partial [Ilumatobacter sp.]|nr:sigma-70 family RNA polymerase sigma factor [Ilumatobacter sp.]